MSETSECSLIQGVTAGGEKGMGFSANVQVVFGGEEYKGKRVKGLYREA